MDLNQIIDQVTPGTHVVIIAPLTDIQAAISKYLTTEEEDFASYLIPHLMEHHNCVLEVDEKTIVLVDKSEVQGILDHLNFEL